MSSSLLADRPWQTPGLDAPVTHRVRSMITDDESRYLYWLARDGYTGAGAIVDSGPLLGRSTVSMAEGVRRNGRVTDSHKTGRIHSYDLFAYEPYMAHLFEDEPTPAPGESLLPRFMDATEPWRPLIQVHPGDIQQYSWADGPIEILFIDLAKTWSLQAHLLREFFPHLIPGVSTVVQQDYFFHGCHWIHLVMEHLADYFTPVHMPDGPTLGFALEKAIPPALLRIDYERLFSPRDALGLMDRAAARFPGAKRLVALTAKASLLLALDDAHGAAAVLESIRRSPDFDATVAFDFDHTAQRLVPLLTRPAAPAARGRTLPTESDAQFLRDLIVETRPDAAIAIGEGPHDASVVLLDALSETTPDAPLDRVRVYSFIAGANGDTIAETTSAPVAAGHTSPPSLLRCETKTGGQSLDARQMLDGRRFSFAFIDGSRHHPWPAAHLLALLPVLAPGAWIALHDIRLPLFNSPALQGQGARHLFESWPGDTRRGGNANNIGAIRLPDNLSTAPGMIARALRETWEALPPLSLRATLGIEPDPASSGTVMRGVHLVQQATATGRPVYLWGAGASGRHLLTLLRDHDVPVTGFVDRSPGKQGTRVDDLVVGAPESLERGRCPRPYIGVSGMFAGEIANGLLAAGWTRDVDYAVL